MKKPIALLILMTATAPCIVQNIITDRPDQTESSRTVPKGMLQIESGVLAEFLGADSLQLTRWLVPTNLLRVGLAHGLELRVLSQVETQKIRGSDNPGRTKLGMSNLEIGAKVELYIPEDKNIEIGFLSNVVFPSGSFGDNRETYGSISRFLIAHQLGKKASVGYNIGYDYFGFGRGDLTYTLAFNFALGSYLSLYLEPYGSIVNLDAHEASFDAGFAYLVRDNMQADFSFGTGLNYTMNYVSVGFSILLDGTKRSADRFKN